ncbi:hypothetical protein SNOG_14467 [Parastagonospora nodorum SN15]|uniref:Uncharacterized protein n=1 Tax=Phaeosphaeria nodorum (strain SN15 / ATCC MYA-4574 / FGSC 10173) TaxID=321614 RepID=Q0U0W0_PHANO|nr:hypothetical protein SNOG_14467 [Parastagonospora nodorum SN15]EAT78007.1 hypothetical protein SNOG_14467 [Parastagonospora nodorum SN15]
MSETDEQEVQPVWSRLFLRRPMPSEKFCSTPFTCSRRPLTLADYLWDSLVKDHMPSDEDVLEDFGFNNTHRGRYFPWFLENLHVLDQPISKEEAQQKLVVTFYDKAKPYLDVEDRSKVFGDLKPQAQRHSYHLLAEMQHRWSPNPVEENWYSFGFVTCRNRSEERTLLGLYQLLLIPNDESSLYRIHNRQQGTMPPVPFTEFWKAYESKSLIMLMDAKGLREVRSRLPFLEVFLSAPTSIIRPSVWDLKQFLEIRNPVENPPTSSGLRGSESSQASRSLCG